MAGEVFPDTLPLGGASNPNYVPSQSSSSTTQARILRAEYGDGYSQRAADGINNRVKTWDVSWVGIPTAESNNIVAFFVARNGFEAFRWDDPLEDGSTQEFWVCEEWSRSPTSGGHQTVTATFRQVFDLGL